LCEICEKRKRKEKDKIKGKENTVIFLRKRPTTQL
jgi:hypothetical protein